VFVVVDIVYFFIDSVREILDLPSYCIDSRSLLFHGIRYL